MEREQLADKDTLPDDATGSLEFLFIINPYAGNRFTNWQTEIATHFSLTNHSFEIYVLQTGFTMQLVKETIAAFNPAKVVAVGGDGTVSLIAECLLLKNIPLGILPAGSANGLAKELGISEMPRLALNTIIAGTVKKIHVIKVNDRICIHLSDIGFNACIIKKFQTENIRGLRGYLKAALKVLWSAFFINPVMQVCIILDNETIEIKAGMIVIANATSYRSGAVINPSGNLQDEVFEVIAIKKISLLEIFKMIVSHASFNSNKTVVFKTSHLTMRPARKAYFQVDGEYLGKVSKIEAVLIPAAIEVIVPGLQPQ